MIQIPVGSFLALVDRADTDLVADRIWHPRSDNGGRVIYAQTNIVKPGGGRTTLQMHRLIMDAPKGVRVDHINHDGLDNRRCNLRLATHSENLRNQRLSRYNSTGRKGVRRRGNRYEARITIEGTTLYLGGFPDRDSASDAYDVAALEYHGEFALTNEMMGCLP